MTLRATASRTFMHTVHKLRPISVQCQYRRCLDRISLLAHRQQPNKTTTSVVRRVRVHPCHNTSSHPYTVYLRRSCALENSPRRVCVRVCVPIKLLRTIHGRTDALSPPHGVAERWRRQWRSGISSPGEIVGRVVLTVRAEITGQRLVARR